MRSFEFRHVAQSLYGVPWAILHEKLAELHAVLTRRAAGAGPSLEDLARIERRARKKFDEAEPLHGPSAELRNVVGLPVRQYGKVAVMPLLGVISQRMSLFSSYSGGTSTEQFGKAFDQLCMDRATKCIVFDCDSPGGSVSGVPELAAKILGARADKKLYCVCNGMMASAAYWIGSAAQECWITPSGMAGSIGVYSMHVDYSKLNEDQGVKPTYVSAGKYKIEGNPDEPLDDEAREAMQDVVDAFYDQFVKAVAKQRGATETAVRNGYGEGRVLTANAAIAAGLVDRVGTMEQLLGKLGADSSPPAGPGASIAEAELRLLEE